MCYNTSSFFHPCTKSSVMQPTDKVTQCTRNAPSHTSVRPQTKSCKLGFFNQIDFPFTVQLHKSTERMGQQSLSLAQPWIKRLLKHHLRHPSRLRLSCLSPQHALGYFPPKLREVGCKPTPNWNDQTLHCCQCPHMVKAEENQVQNIFVKKSLFSQNRCRFIKKDQAMFSAFMFKYEEFLLPPAI